jgi:hypothetical protein|tara:strand:- start:1119 stop:1493 length:375 start_codon:yes stop_codon:yes gene_type:complete
MEQFRKVDYEKEAMTYRAIVFVLAVVISIVPLLAVFGVLKPEQESAGIWFQRCGSIVVLLGSLAEYYSFKMHSVFSPEHLANEPLFNTKLKYCLQAKRLMAISALFIAMGTVIWGYGDLFFKNA